VNLTLDPVVYTGARELAYAEGVSVSEMVNRLLMASLGEGAKERIKQAAARQKAMEESVVEVVRSARALTGGEPPVTQPPAKERKVVRKTASAKR
jgi:phosphoribosylamine-glycine ligase